MEVSNAAQWVIGRVVDLGIVAVVVAVIGSGAARLGIYCWESVRKTWLTRAGQ